MVKAGTIIPMDKKSNGSGMVATKIPSSMIHSNTKTTSIGKSDPIKVTANSNTTTLSLNENPSYTSAPKSHINTRAKLASVAPNVSLPAANTTGYTVAVARTDTYGDKASYLSKANISNNHIAGITKSESTVKTPNTGAMITNTKIDTNATGGRKDNNRKIDSDTATAAITERQNGIRNATSDNTGENNSNGRSDDNRPVAGGNAETGNNHRHGNGRNASGNGQTADTSLASELARSKYQQIETTNSNSNVVAVKAPVSVTKNQESTTYTKVENRIIVRETKETSNHEMRVAENITVKNISDVKTSAGITTKSDSRPVIAGKVNSQIGPISNEKLSDSRPVKIAKETKTITEIRELKGNNLPTKPVPSPKPSI